MLHHLAAKRKDIFDLIEVCKKKLEENSLFTKREDNPEIRDIKSKLYSDFTDAIANLGEISRQITWYLRRIEIQSQFVKKIRKLKYLKDQLTWKNDTGILPVLQSASPIFLSPYSYPFIFPSLLRFESFYEAADFLRNLRVKTGETKEREEAPSVTPKEAKEHLFNTHQDKISLIWKGFIGQKEDLLTYLKSFGKLNEISEKDIVNLYCLMVGVYASSLRFTSNFSIHNNQKFHIVYAKFN